MVQTINSELQIISRAINATVTLMSPEVARFLLAIQLTPEDKNRVNELAHKNRAGELQQDESTELEEYLRVGRMMDLLKLQAKAILKSQ